MESLESYHRRNTPSSHTRFKLLISLDTPLYNSLFPLLAFARSYHIQFRIENSTIQFYILYTKHTGVFSLTILWKLPSVSYWMFFNIIPKKSPKDRIVCLYPSHMNPMNTAELEQEKETTLFCEKGRSQTNIQRNCQYIIPPLLCMKNSLSSSPLLHLYL